MALSNSDGSGVALPPRSMYSWNGAAWVPFTGAGGGGGGTLSAEYNVTPPVLSDTDETPLQTNSSGALLTEITNAGTAIGIGAGTAATALRVTLPSDGAGALGSLAGSSLAHDAVDSGNPHKIGGKAVSALSAITLVASGDRADAAFDLDGALIVRNGGAIGDRVSATASNTDGASTACIAAQAAGIKVNLTDVTLVNMHATSDIYVEIKDGATVKWVFPVPHLGGVTHRFETPLTGSAATAWNFDPSAATTTIYCSMAGRLSKV